MHQSSLPSINDYNWRVRKVFNWIGTHEYMVELLSLEECVGFGDTFSEAKRNMEDSMKLYIQRNGVYGLPEPYVSAQLIVLEEPMSHEEFSYINQELIALDQG
ncbi:hypothetical protein [Shouchella patagoniensis]|uniref:hypothetical protein n=1 Tax=Shouchella patagoniensis TaxID=228576 RepID=UPI000995B305|nr:hypothetical protein [Shouchella patagoniensis]